MATIKHISSKNADYGAAEAYLTFEHDEFTMKPTLDEAGRLIPRQDYRLDTLNCGEEDFALSCIRANLRYGKNSKREDIKSHHYIISFDPRDAADNGLTVDRAQALGLAYCKPKEAYFPEGKTLFGLDRHPAECDCQRAQRIEREAAEQQRRHLDTVEDLKRRGFSDTAMRDWTFENDNGRNPQTAVARFYAEHWDTMQAENIGYLFWGGVGTGKSYLAGCIANALMEQKIPVRMTNFAAILNDLAASFEGRNEYISRLCRYPLLILDDFGMERDTAYGLEQVYSVIDSRYRSRRPLIVTTNLTLQQIQNPTDTAYARIYDRLLEMCAPVRFTGGNFRRETAQAKLERLKNLMNE